MLDFAHLQHTKALFSFLFLHRQRYWNRCVDGGLLSFFFPTRRKWMWHKWQKNSIKLYKVKDNTKVLSRWTIDRVRSAEQLLCCSMTLLQHCHYLSPRLMAAMSQCKPSKLTMMDFDHGSLTSHSELWFWEFNEWGIRFQSVRMQFSDASNHFT